jgi:hypothetical protein
LGEPTIIHPLHDAADCDQCARALRDRASGHMKIIAQTRKWPIRAVL